MAFASVQVERYGFSLLAPVLLVTSQLPVSLSAALSRRVCYLSCPWCEAAMCAGVLAELDMRVTMRSISDTGAVLAKVAGAHNECSIAVISISMATYKSNVSYMRTSVLVTTNRLLLFVLTPVTPEKK